MRSFKRWWCWLLDCWEMRPRLPRHLSAMKMHCAPNHDLIISLEATSQVEIRKWFRYINNFYELRALDWHLDYTIDRSGPTDELADVFKVRLTFVPCDNFGIIAKDESWLRAFKPPPVCEPAEVCDPDGNEPPSPLP